MQRARYEAKKNAHLLYDKLENNVRTETST